MTKNDRHGDGRGDGPDESCGAVRHDITLPIFGEFHLVTAMFFDAGIYLIVVGLVLDVLRSLGAGLDEQGPVVARNALDDLERVSQ